MKPMIAVTNGGNSILILVSQIATRKGARTGLWLPNEKKFILSVPARGGEEAALWVYGM